MIGIESWLFSYGSFALFCLLALGIVGLPIPDETLIIVAGALVARGKLSLFPTLLAVYGGGLCGITLSYLLGYTGGDYIVRKVGYLIGLSPMRIEKAKKWYKKIGKWSLFFGYFIVGLRHLAGFTSGLMKLEYRQFALFAYSGLLVWATTIFALGYSFSDSWRQKLGNIIYIGILIAIIALLGIYGYFFYKQRNLD